MYIKYECNIQQLNLYGKIIMNEEQGVVKVGEKVDFIIFYDLKFCFNLSFKYYVWCCV